MAGSQGRFLGSASWSAASHLAVSRVFLWTRTREGAEVPCAVPNMRTHSGFRQWFCVRRPFLKLCPSEGLRFVELTSVRVELLYLTESYSSVHVCLMGQPREQICFIHWVCPSGT